MKQKRQKFNSFYSILLSITALAVLTAPISGLADQSIAQKKQTLEQQLQQLNQQISSLQSQITGQQKQSASLKNEIGLYNTQIQQTQLKIQATETSIDNTNLEITDTKAQIQDTNNQISQSQQVITQLIIGMNDQDNVSGIQLGLGSQNFSNFLDQVQYNKSVQHQISNILTQLADLKQKLQTDQQLLQTSLNQLTTLNNQLNSNKLTYEGEKADKTQLLAQTQGKESQYKKLLGNTQSQESKLAQEIAALDKQAGTPANRLPVNHGILAWPVQGTLTQGYGNTGFTSLGYSFHNGLDIAGPAGAPVSAAADGVVYATGTGTTAYGNWVTIEHNIDGHQIITLYGHFMSFVVSKGQSVKRGDLIGFEGNTGNTSRLLYGPEHGYHVHFSVFDASGFRITPGAYQSQYGSYQIPNGYTYNPYDFL